MVWKGWGGRVWAGGSGERLLPLLLRLIKTAPTFFLNHPASQRTKHFYQCLYFVKQWQVGCQGPLWPCFRGPTPQGPAATLNYCHFCESTNDARTHGNKCRHRCTLTHETTMYSHRHTLLPLRVAWWVCCDPRSPHCRQGSGGQTSLEPRLVATAY